MVQHTGEDGDIRTPIGQIDCGNIADEILLAGGMSIGGPDALR